MSLRHLDQVLAEVGPLGDVFADAGHRLYLVGGVVRDQLLDQPLGSSSDIDLTTDARPDRIKKLVAPFADDLWTQGERFGTIGLRADGRDLEITTHRAESYSDGSRKPQVSFGDDIVTDLSRRDFTVNAMAIELPDGDLVDPYGGAADLDARLLRTPLSPEISFTDDPLRMLRAARFAATFSLTPDAELVDAATELRERVRIVAIERIEVEVRRLLGLDAAAAGLEFLAETGVLGEVLAYGEPGLLGTVRERAARAVEVVDSLDAEWTLRLSAIGLAVFGTVDGVHAMCLRLRLSRDDRRTVVAVARAAMEIVHAHEFPASVLRRWVHANADTPEAWAIAVANAVTPTDGHVDAFVSSLAELRATEPTSDVHFLSGERIMQVLEMAPGPAIGQAQTALKNAYFERGPLPEADQIEVLLQWSTTLGHLRSD